MMKIGNREFNTEKHTYIMGILNVTPDSFSDGGKYRTSDAALKRAEEMIGEGADIIDVGAESTRPGAVPVTDEEEINRAVPVISKIKSEFDIPVSFDTYKSRAAKAGIEAGADLINDIWGLSFDPDMARVIREADVCCCLMHNRKEPSYVNFIDDFYSDMRNLLDNALKSGIQRDRIILDPGIGFAKNTGQSLKVLDTMERLNSFDVPWLLGASRKSVIGNTLKLPVDERLEGTLATTALAVFKGASFVRVHDIAENKRLITMLEAVHGRD